MQPVNFIPNRPDPVFVSELLAHGDGTIFIAVPKKEFLYQWAKETETSTEFLDGIRVSDYAKVGLVTRNDGPLDETLVVEVSGVDIAVNPAARLEEVCDLYVIGRVE